MMSQVDVVVTSALAMGFISKKEKKQRRLNNLKHEWEWSDSEKQKAQEFPFSRFIPATFVSLRIEAQSC